MSRAYDPQYRELALEVGRDLGITLRQGVYMAISGPSYSTPAELRMLITLGADTVGMSTIPGSHRGQLPGYARAGYFLHNRYGPAR